MPTLPPLVRLLGLRLVAPGEPAPLLSLTAEDGTWIRLVDLRGRLKPVLLFLHSLEDPADIAWLQGFEARLSRFEDLGAVVFGIAGLRTDALREHRLRLGLGFHLLYDPLALAARSYGLARPLRRLGQCGAVVVGEDGTVLACHRDRVPVEDLLALLSAEQGRTSPPVSEPRRAAAGSDPRRAHTAVRDIDALAAAALLAETSPCWLLLDVRAAEAHSAWHPSGARHIPLDELPDRYSEIGQDTHVICLSETGGESLSAAQFLASVGFRNVVNVLDGISGWPGAPESPLSGESPPPPHVFPPLSRC
ncbi:MAG: redoxin domain-containing protein [Deltaproteobacteria bacterium]|nr:redoxin domain-containing protein [Deltaproteobacteria bacterium]